MNKTFKLYGIIFIVVMVLLVILEMSKTEVVDWSKNYDVTEKTPFGLFIFNDQAPHLLKDGLQKIAASPYDYYQDNKTYEAHNILLVDQNVDQQSWKKVMKMVENGSDVLLITDRNIRAVVDTFDVSVNEINFDEVNTLQFTEEKLKENTLRLEKFPNRKGFLYLPKSVDVIGGTAAKATTAANFIKITHGQGHLYYHTEPLFLTNYYLLQPNGAQYLENVFSYLPPRKTLWFTAETQAGKSASPLSFILSNPPLRYAWYLLLGSLVLFVLFNAKRKQRIIPIIKPLENKSVEFVKSIGNLYLQEGNLHDMMAKKAQYFLHKIRMDYYIDTKNLDDNFINKLQLKTGKPLPKVKQAVSYIIRAQNPYANVQKDDLIRMNRLLDEILK